MLEKLIIRLAELVVTKLTTAHADVAVDQAGKLFPRVSTVLTNFEHTLLDAISNDVQTLIARVLKEDDVDV